MSYIFFCVNNSVSWIFFHGNNTISQGYDGIYCWTNKMDKSYIDFYHTWQKGYNLRMTTWPVYFYLEMTVFYVDGMSDYTVSIKHIEHKVC